MGEIFMSCEFFQVYMSMLACSTGWKLGECTYMKRLIYVRTSGVES